jgi:hypothetical protein
MKIFQSRAIMPWTYAVPGAGPLYPCPRFLQCPAFSQIRPGHRSLERIRNT